MAHVRELTVMCALINIYAASVVLLANGLLYRGI